MSTTQQDNIVLKLAEPIPMPIKTDGTADVNAGDQVYFDSTAKVVKSSGSDANNATFAGVAMNGSFVQPYTAKLYGAGMIPVMQKGIVRFNTTSGDTYSEGDAVYYTVDAQTITNTVGGNSNIIGYVKLAAGTTSLAGASGVTVMIMLAPKWPTTAFA